MIHPRSHVSAHVLALPDGAPLHYARTEPGPAAGRVPLVIALHYGWQGALPERHARDFLRVFAERAVLALREHLLATLPVDAARMLLTGFSLGGMGTWFLAAHHPVDFPLAVPVAAVPVLQRGSADRSGLAEFLDAAGRGEPPVWHDGLVQSRFYAVNSRADELIPFEPVDAGVRALQRRGADIEVLALDGVGHYESMRFAAAMGPVRDWVQSAWLTAAPHR